MVDHIENTLFAVGGTSLCAQIVQNEKIGTHEGFEIMLPISTEIALHTVDGIGHADQQNGNLSVDQGVGNAASRIGFACTNTAEQE